jgi:CRISPR-associated exonuclease Cas4
MMFALLRSWASALRAQRISDGEEEVSPRKQSDSVIFAMEEPELFLHPHAQRRLSASLREIAETPQHQVFLCTHSTHFVDLANYKEVAIVTKEDAAAGSRVRQCTDELFAGDGIDDRKKRFHMAEWINPDRGEMFFARRVVFVEGETEKVVIPYIAEKIGIFDPDVSIIDCGAKHNLPLYISIAKAFQIPYLVIHDEDPLPDPIPEAWNADKVREKERTFTLNEDIAGLVEQPLGHVEIFSPDFEGAAGVSKKQGKNKGKALAALEFFEEKEIKDVPEIVAYIARAVYERPGSQEE